MSRIFFDTNLFVYLLEEFGELGVRVADLVQRMIERHDELITSTLTLGELLVKPTMVGNLELIERCESMIATPGVTVIPFDRSCAKIYSQIRALDKTIKPPDAVQLACAAHARCDMFITNDERLSRKVIPGIQFVTSLSRAFI